MNEYTIKKEEIKDKYREIIKILKLLKGKFFKTDLFGVMYWSKNNGFIFYIRNFHRDIILIKEIEEVYRISKLL